MFFNPLFIEKSSGSSGAAVTKNSKITGASYLFNDIINVLANNMPAADTKSTTGTGKTLNDNDSIELNLLQTAEIDTENYKPGDVKKFVENLLSLLSNEQGTENINIADFKVPKEKLESLLKSVISQIKFTNSDNKDSASEHISENKIFQLLDENKGVVIAVNQPKSISSFQVVKETGESINPLLSNNDTSEYVVVYKEKNLDNNEQNDQVGLTFAYTGAINPIIAGITNKSEVASDNLVNKDEKQNVTFYSYVKKESDNNIPNTNYQFAPLLNNSQKSNIEQQQNVFIKSDGEISLPEGDANNTLNVETNTNLTSMVNDVNTKQNININNSGLKVNKVNSKSNEDSNIPKTADEKQTPLTTKTVIEKISQLINTEDTELKEEIKSDLSKGSIKIEKKSEVMGEPVNLTKSSNTILNKEVKTVDTKSILSSESKDGINSKVKLTENEDIPLKSENTVNRVANADTEIVSTEDKKEKPLNNTKNPIDKNVPSLINGTENKTNETAKENNNLNIKSTGERVTNSNEKKDNAEILNVDNNNASKIVVETNKINSDNESVEKINLSDKKEVSSTPNNNILEQLNKDENLSTLKSEVSNKNYSDNSNAKMPVETNIKQVEKVKEKAANEDIPNVVLDKKQTEIKNDTLISKENTDNKKLVNEINEVSDKTVNKKTEIVNTPSAKILTGEEENIPKVVSTDKEINNNTPQFSENEAAKVSNKKIDNKSDDTINNKPIIEKILVDEKATINSKQSIDKVAENTNTKIELNDSLKNLEGNFKEAVNEPKIINKPDNYVDPIKEKIEGNNLAQKNNTVSDEVVAKENSDINTVSKVNIGEVKSSDDQTPKTNNNNLTNTLNQKVDNTIKETSVNEKVNAEIKLTEKNATVINKENIVYSDSIKPENNETIININVNNEGNKNSVYEKVKIKDDSLLTNNKVNNINFAVDEGIQTEIKIPKGNELPVDMTENKSGLSSISNKENLTTVEEVKLADKKMVTENVVTELKTEQNKSEINNTENIESTDVPKNTIKTKESEFVQGITLQTKSDNVKDKSTTEKNENKNTIENNIKSVNNSKPYDENVREFTDKEVVNNSVNEISGNKNNSSIKNDKTSVEQGISTDKSYPDSKFDNKINTNIYQTTKENVTLQKDESLQKGNVESVEEKNINYSFKPIEETKNGELTTNTEEIVTANKASDKKEVSFTKPEVLLKETEKQKNKQSDKIANQEIVNKEVPTEKILNKENNNISNDKGGIPLVNDKNIKQADSAEKVNNKNGEIIGTTDKTDKTKSVEITNEKLNSSFIATKQTDIDKQDNIKVKKNITSFSLHPNKSIETKEVDSDRNKGKNYADTEANISQNDKMKQGSENKENIGSEQLIKNTIKQRTGNENIVETNKVLNINESEKSENKKVVIDSGKENTTTIAKSTTEDAVKGQNKTSKVKEEKEDKPINLKVKKTVKDVTEQKQEQVKTEIVVDTKDKKTILNDPINHETSAEKTVNVTDNGKQSNMGNNTESKEHKDLSAGLNIKIGETDNTRTGKVFEETYVKSGNERNVKLTEVIKEVSRYLEKQDKSSMTLNIEPENMGKVKISVEVNDKIVKANITVETEVVKNMLESKLGDLQSNLNKNGNQQGMINISLQNNENKNSERNAGKRKPAGENKQIDKIENETEEIKKSLGYNTVEYLA